MTISKDGLIAGAPQSFNTLVDRINDVLGSMSAAELGYIDGVTAGQSAASKAVVLGADSKIDTLDITALKLNGTACDEAFLSGAAKAANVAANTSIPATTISIANASPAAAAYPNDLPTTIALCNSVKAQLVGIAALCNSAKAQINAIITENATFKTTINAEIAALKAAGLQATS